MMKRIFYLLLVCSGGCSMDPALLQGEWQAVAFYEKGQTLPVSLDSVRLSFSDNAGYEFRSIGFYRESGPFRVSGNTLFLTDTTTGPAREHILEVLFLSADSLKIRMQKKDAEQVLFLKKKS